MKKSTEPWRLTFFGQDSDLFDGLKVLGDDEQLGQLLDLPARSFSRPTRGVFILIVQTNKNAYENRYTHVYGDGTCLQELEH